MSRAETDRQLRWLMTLRVVIVTTLLICAFSIELLMRAIETLRPLFTLAAGAYGMVLLYAVLDRWLRGTRTFIFVQLVGDAVIITAFVGITGGIHSPMSFLYLLPISVASMLLYRGGSLAVAVMSWMLYGSLVILGPKSWPILGYPDSFIPTSGHGRVVYSLVAHFVAMVAFAVLSSYLSERIRAQRRELLERSGAVARLKALNENIIGSINSGLITTNLDGQINFMNQGGQEIIGFNQRDVVGRGVNDFFHLGEGFLSEIRRRLRAKRRFRFERHFDTHDGRRIFLGIAVSNLRDRAGRPLGYIFIFQDLTEIHALEQEVRLSERIVALGEMGAGMAHELRNPLAAISGAVQYLKSDIKPEGETLELMDIILRESHRLDQAIRDFLAFARPGPFKSEETDLVRLISDNVKLLTKSHDLRRKHIIETDFSEERVVCDVDPNRIKQVFWNLATNGLKSMPDGGTLKISVQMAEDDGSVCIRFSDQGIGMDADQMERYFQPFSSSFKEGTGLGAAIVYRLIEEHGGKIAVDSSSGNGTTVTITLQRSNIAGSVQPTPSRLRAAGSA